MSRIRHATESFVNTLVEGVQKLIATNTEQISILSSERGYLTTKDISGLDANTISENGKYKGAYIINAPNTGWWAVDVTKDESSHLVQEWNGLGSQNAGVSFTRTRNGSNWVTKNIGDEMNVLSSKVNKGGTTIDTTLTNTINSRVSSGILTGYFDFNTASDFPLSSGWGCCCTYKVINDGRVWVEVKRTGATMPFFQEYHRVGGASLLADGWKQQATTDKVDILSSDATITDATRQIKMVNGWKKHISSNVSSICRVGNIVTLNMYISNPSQVVDSVCLNVPSKYRPQQNCPTICFIEGNVAGIDILVTGDVKIWGTINANNRVTVQSTYIV